MPELKPLLTPLFDMGWRVEVIDMPSSMSQVPDHVVRLSRYESLPEILEGNQVVELARMLLEADAECRLRDRACAKDFIASINNPSPIAGGVDPFS